MLLEKYIRFKTSEDFILDKDFFLWVMHPDKNRDVFWNSFMKEYPEKQVLIREAVFIIKSLQPIETEVPLENLQKIHDKIFNLSRKSNRFTILKLAAVAILFITIGTFIWYSLTENQFPIDTNNQLGQKGKIILSNGATHEFDTDQSTIRQNTSGSLTINNDTINLVVRTKGSAMNQIIIPYGKRTEITLSDGTHIWLNSGSQLSYPVEFNANKREVFLQGEAYFDVTPNQRQPFYVITREVKIKVLGTSFNVSSYGEDKKVETVLVKGEVMAQENKLFGNTINLIPGERMTYNKANENLSKDKVEVNLYASWINGYLIFRNEPLTSVLKKIERFYNKEIQLEKGLEEMTFSGKLDLKDNFQDVLRNISFGSSVLIIQNEESYIIKQKAYE